MKIPDSLDHKTRRSIDGALHRARSHPAAYALEPAAKIALAVGLGVVSLVYMGSVFALVIQLNNGP